MEDLWARRGLLRDRASGIAPGDSARLRESYLASLGNCAGGHPSLGIRAWPGIVLGSFSVDIMTAIRAENATSLFTPVCLAASIGVGAALQALAGAFLVRRFAAWPGWIEAEINIFKFL